MIEPVLVAADPLATFNAAGVLAPVDVHVATTIGRILGEDSADVLLAAALAVRAPRFGHVCADLASLRTTVTVDEDAELGVDELPWPDPGPWTEAVAASRLVGHGKPLRLDGTRLYLDRYWRAEQAVAAYLLAAADDVVDDVDEGAVTAIVDGLFSDDDGGAADAAALQRRAAATVAGRRLTVIAGGPGTGKTYTIRKVIELLNALAERAGKPAPKVALAAPTGKAAARVTESIGGGYEALTVHRLLRRHPGNATRFRHNATNPLPHDVVILDETSMVSLTLMAKLLAAVRPDARVVLVGDPDQLVSVEAGAVLGDVVDPAREQASGGGERPPLAGGIVVLDHVRRYGKDSGIAALANAIKGEDPDDVLDVLAAGRDDVTWIDADVADEAGRDTALRPVRTALAAAAAAATTAAAAGQGMEALAAIDSIRVLCAHRRGPYGVATWIPHIERWLSEDVEGFDPAELWYLGRPVIVTSNDYTLRVFNGDTGVTVADGGRRTLAFATPDGGWRKIAPHRLEAVDTVHAMTIHKSQGSQFRSAVVLLPDDTSPILTRELLYTAVTRAQEHLTVVGTPGAIRTAVERRVHRSSGLRTALWGTGA